MTSVDVDVDTNHNGGDRKLIILGIVAVVAMLVTGSIVGYSLTHNEKAVSQGEAAIQANTDALVAVCSSLTTMRFVFEQLAELDHRIARDPALSVTTRADVRARATLYETAVVALSDIRECRKIE